MDKSPLPVCLQGWSVYFNHVSLQTLLKMKKNIFCGSVVLQTLTHSGTALT